jgi:hypothetical protein
MHRWKREEVAEPRAPQNLGTGQNTKQIAAMFVRIFLTLRNQIIELHMHNYSNIKGGTQTEGI